MDNVLTGAFFTPDAYSTTQVVPSNPIYRPVARRVAPKLNKKVDTAVLQRVLDGGDVGQLLALTGLQAADLQRAITSTTTGFPVRENLEAVAKILIPLETPLRNRIPRVPGAGTAAQWRQLLSLGGGYAGATTGSITAGSPNLTVASSAGFAGGDTITIDTGANIETKIVLSITDATHIVLTSNAAATHASVAVVKFGVQPGSSSTGAIQAFYSETGAPGQHQSVYAAQSSGYKLLGTIGAVTGFAMAAGANFQNQLATEKRNAVWNLMLNEENALVNGDAASALAPWGDGTNPLAFNGLVNLITTANGTPADQVQTNVGPLTTAFIDTMLTKVWKQGGRDQWIMVSYQEQNSLVHLAEANGSIIRVTASSSTGETVLGVKVAAYIHPITGEKIPIMVSRFLSPGIMIFGSDTLPDGNPTLQVDVLPQVQLPQLAPNMNIQGYVAQEIAPSQTAPQVYPFLVSVFETLKMKSSLHFAIAKGVTAV